MLLSFIIAGLTLGSVYGLAAVGLVLTYKTSAIFNFAHGALATVSAYLFFSLFVRRDVPWPVAALICVVVVGPLMGVGLERVARALSRANLAERILATVGLLLIVQSVVSLIYGTETTDTVPQFLPQGSFELAGARVGADDLIIMAIGIAATAGLWVYFRTARTGIAMRAVVDDPDLLDLSGTSPVRVRRIAWIIGVCFASASGVLLAPLVTLDPTTLTFLIVQAFGAAAIGRFSNLPLTFVGGLIIGVASSLATREFTDGLLANLPAALPFLLLFIILLFSRRDRMAGRTLVRPTDGAAWRAPWPLQLLTGLVLTVILYLVPSFAGIHLADWTLFLTSAIVLLSLGLLVRTSGQVSLAMGGFTAIGACAFAHLSIDGGLPWALALLGAGSVAVPIGALLSIPAIRLSGLYLALATLGFSVLLAYMFYNQPYMFGDGLGLQPPTPSGFSTPTAFYYLVLLLTALVIAGVLLLGRSRLGRLLRALGDSPLGLETGGTSVNVTRVLVFCISAFLAAIAGALAGVATGVVAADSYPPLLSLTYFAVVLVAVGGAPWYALLGGAGLALVPSYVEGADTGYYLELVFGVSALLFAVIPPERRGVPPRLAVAVDRAFLPMTEWADRLRSGRRRAAASPIHSGDGLPVATPVTLEARDVTVRFGGLVAVNGVTFEVATGTIVGLIGPNGAGKSSLFDAVSGVNRRSSGNVLFGGRDVGRLGTPARARMGLGRTFQQMQLFSSLTVAENVALGREGALAGTNPLAHIVSAPRRRNEIRAAAEQAMELCGISSLADEVVGRLSTGQQRRVDLARCLAGPYDLILLDEPSSGLDHAETAEFGRILRSAVAARGLGVLLVEHDMTLVAEVCEYVYVLDFGSLIFQGPTAEVLDSPIVHAAYLGEPGADKVLEPALNAAPVQAERS